MPIAPGYNISEQLWYWTTISGLTMTGLRKKAGLTASQISRFIRCKQAAGGIVLERIANALEITVHEFLGDKPQMLKVERKKYGKGKSQRPEGITEERVLQILNRSGKNYLKPHEEEPLCIRRQVVDEGHKINGLKYFVDPSCGGGMSY